MTEERLSDLLRTAVPEQGPAISTDDVLRGARRRRRTTAVVAVLSAAALVTGPALLLSRGGTTHVPTDGRIVPGASTPSPYPYEPISGDNVCEVDHPAGDDGLLTRTVTTGPAGTLAPPGDIAPLHTRTEALQRWSEQGFFRHSSGHPQAYFGLLSAATPARINPDGSSTPFYTNKPVWVVVLCDAPSEAIAHHGPMSLQPTPAPGTSPSPGAPVYAVIIEPMDQNLARLDTTVTGRPSEELREETFVEVPFEQVEDPSLLPEQVAISYAAAEPCATFDHLDVSETDADVRVLVWLRVEEGGSCDGAETRRAVVGLRSPLGDRPLVRGARR